MLPEAAIDALIETARHYALALIRGKPVRCGEEAAVAIRRIYFSPEGILPVLKSLHDGESISRDELREVLMKFAHTQKHVEQQLSRLDWSELGQDLDLEIYTMNALQYLGSEKRSLRSAIIRSVHRITEEERRPRGWKEDLGLLIERIEDLNRAIEEMDDALRHVRTQGTAEDSAP